MRAEVCRCGHDRASHWEEKHTCLGMLCECKQYTHRDDPLPPPAKKPAAYPFIEFSIDLSDYPTPVTHPYWCVCGVCYPNGKP